MSRASTRAVEWKKLADRYAGIPLHAAAHLVETAGSLFRATPAVREVRHIVLIKLWGVGNLAMILPYLSHLRRRHPQAEVALITLHRNREIVSRHPAIDRVYTLRDRSAWALGIDLVRLVRELRRWRVDLTLDFEQFLRLSGLIAWLSGSHQTVGFETPRQHRSLLYQARVPYRGDRHMSLVFADILRAAGVETPAEPPVRTELPRGVPSAHLRAELPRPWILLHPGSGDNFPGRRWPPERFAVAAAALRHRHGGSLFLSGTEEEGELLDQVGEALVGHGAPAIELGRRLRLPDWLSSIEACDLLLSNDTGSVHLASAVGTPVLAIYGPNTPALYGPLGKRSRAIYHALPCSPCLTNQNGKTSSCRLPLCVLSISVEEVVQAAHGLLQPARDASR